jgi:hypothetical protein
MATTPSRAAVKQGIYIDFEGTQTDPPVMLGIFWVTPDGEEHFEQLIFNPILDSAAQAKGKESGDGACIVVGSLEAAFTRALELSEELGVPIVEWSFREEQVLDASRLSETMIRRIKSRILNGLPVARRWARRTQERSALKPDRRGKRYTLSNFAKLTGYDVPSLYGAGNSASRVREVLRQIERRGDYRLITGVAKRKWHSFLKHNEHDLRATRHVMLHIVRPAQGNSDSLLRGTSETSNEFAKFSRIIRNNNIDNTTCQYV